MNNNSLGERVFHRKMTRRDFLWLASLSAAGTLVGCAVNPVTGEKQLMLMSEAQEIDIDRKNSPHQFSADYGALDEHALNSYISGVGRKMTALSHRPQMPFSFRGVNATYVNAYAFPGGSIAATRGILLALDNEAELAGLLGHEIGHVNARHTAERMSKSMLIGAALAGANAYVQAAHKQYAGLAAGLGGIGAGMLLARYSRDDERQADALGMEYMTKAGYNPNGMVRLMDLLMSLSKHKPNAIEMMFSTHPMSEERYRTAVETAKGTYQSAQSIDLQKDRYGDHTAGLRKIKGAIEEMQKGEKEMAKKQFPQAEAHFEKALKEAPNDYAGLAMMAKCQLAMERPAKARRFAERAKQVKPSEAQAHHIGGVSKLMMKKYGAAYQDFNSYETMLPGNPNTIFLKGVCQEGMQHKKQAADEYLRYLQIVNQGEEAKYAYQRLVEWGYVEKPQQQG